MLLHFLCPELPGYSTSYECAWKCRLVGCLSFACECSDVLENCHYSWQLEIVVTLPTYNCSHADD
jgi:hypothetical protein